jgi:cation/acetate symporter
MATNHPLLRSLLGVTMPLVEARWFQIDAIAAGVFGVPAGLFALIVGSLLSRPPDAEQVALVDRLRVPAAGEH